MKRPQKRYQVEGFWKQPFGNYSAWCRHSQHDTFEDAKRQCDELMTWGDNAPSDVRIIDREEQTR